MKVNTETDYSYWSPRECVERYTVMLLEEGNFGGKLLVSPATWQHLLLGFSHDLPAATKCEICDDQAVIVLCVCGQVLRVIAVRGMSDSEYEFSERKASK